MIKAYRGENPDAPVKDRLTGEKPATPNGLLFPRKK